MKNQMILTALTSGSECFLDASIDELPKKFVVSFDKEDALDILFSFNIEAANEKMCEDIEDEEIEDEDVENDYYLTEDLWYHEHLEQLSEKAKKRLRRRKARKVQHRKQHRNQLKNPYRSYSYVHKQNVWEKVCKMSIEEAAAKKELATIKKAFVGDSDIEKRDSNKKSWYQAMDLFDKISPKILSEMLWEAESYGYPIEVWERIAWVLQESGGLSECKRD